MRNEDAFDGPGTLRSHPELLLSFVSASATGLRITPVLGVADIDAVGEVSKIARTRTPRLQSCRVRGPTHPEGPFRLVQQNLEDSAGVSWAGHLLS